MTGYTISLNATCICYVYQKGTTPCLTESSLRIKIRSGFLRGINCFLYANSISKSAMFEKIHFDVQRLNYLRSNCCFSSRSLSW